MNSLQNKLEKTIQIDNQSILIRPISIDDAQREKDFVAKLSPESRHFRFLGGINELSDKEAQQLYDIDFEDTMAFVAIINNTSDEQQEIGVSRYAADSDGTCECAVAVADEWQNKGLGRELMDTLIEYGRAKNKTSIYSCDLLANTHMKHLADDLGMTRIADSDDPRLIRYELPLGA